MLYETVTQFCVFMALIGTLGVSADSVKTGSDQL